MIKVKKDQFFPADLILLSSSSSKGICYVETKNLDGETNLKHKSCNEELMDLITTDEDACNFSGRVVCSKPNDQIYLFDGYLTHRMREDNKVKIPLFYENFLLRGSSLKNTDWVIGVVTHTGHETRIMMNSTKAKPKSSRVEKLMNVMIVYIFLIQITLCFIAATYGTIWEYIYGPKATYLELNIEEMNAAKRFFIKFGTWILIFTNIVPISLIVTLEMVKYMQAFFISWDHNIHCPEKDMPTKVQSSNLNEELG